MVYHAWVSPILLWDLLLCKTAGVAFITHCHNVFSQQERSARAYFADMPAIYRLSDAVVALSEVDRAYWTNFNDNVVAVVNPLTYSLDDVELSPLEGKNVLWLGRLSDEKRPHDALRIFAKVLEAEPEAKLSMVGSCSDQEYVDGLNALIAELGMRDSVSMCGFHKDVLPFYEQASVVLLTSEYEGFLMVLSESQSVGIPCVMYELPYLTLTSANKGFVAVELGDINAAADAVVKLLSDLDYRRSVGQEARANVEKLARFDFAGVWRGLFQGLSQPAVGRTRDEIARIMWETLLGHYRVGAESSDLQIRHLKKELGAVRRAEKQARGELKRVRASWSFRAGHAITSIPRKMRESVRSLRRGDKKQ
jgi:glycosyltransferase involved in cell wall biosynthesis